LNSVFLPLNEEPELISYTHNAYADCILTSPVVAGETAAKYEIISKHKEFEKIDCGCETVLGQEVSVKVPIMNEKGYSLVVDNCEEKETFIVKVNFRRRISSREHICIIIDEINDAKNYNPDECMTKFGCPSWLRLIVKHKDKYVVEKNSKRILTMGYYLKLEKDGLNISYWYSFDGKHWDKVHEETLSKKYEIIPIKIGVIVETRNDYMNWKASNYIQLFMKSPSAGDLMIDYYHGPTKHYKPFNSNHFFDYLFEYLEHNDFSKNKMIKYLHRKLSEDFYIITMLDHFYVPGTSSYKVGKHYHEILVYGLDCKKKTVKIMAYSSTDDVVAVEISFDDFWKALDPNQIMFILCRLNPNYNRYEINKRIIRKRLRDYLDGINCEYEIEDLAPGEIVMCYGIDIIEHLANDEDDLHIFCNDSRLSYIFYEHKRLMLERFMYLRNNGALNKQFTEDVFEDLEKNVQLAEIMKNNILINTIGNNKKSTMEKIKNYLLEIAANEKRCYEKICDMLGDI